MLRNNFWNSFYMIREQEKNFYHEQKECVSVPPTYTAHALFQEKDFQAVITSVPLANKSK